MEDKYEYSGNLTFYKIKDNGDLEMFGENEFKVTVKTTDLLETLKDNRGKHAVAYENAKKGFRILLIKELEKKLQAAKDGKKVALSFTNQKPDSHLAEYDDVIGMLELSEDPTLIINHQQYKQYIKDEWNWARSWTTSNSAYIGAALSAG